MDQRTIIGHEQQARGVLVQSTHRLHPLDSRFLRSLAQWSREQ